MVFTPIDVIGFITLLYLLRFDSFQYWIKKDYLLQHTTQQQLGKKILNKKNLFKERELIENEYRNYPHRLQLYY